MAVEDIKRLNYYEKQFLQTGDFRDEQAYHIEMRRRHQIAHHRWGVVTGLDVRQDPTSKVWALEAGMAVDGYGREIVVPAPEPLNTAQIAAQLAGASLPATLRVWIAYRPERMQRPAPGYDVCAEEDRFTRVRESFRLLYQDQPPPFGPPRPRDPSLPGDWPRPSDDLPDDPQEAPWPVLLGTLTWNVDPEDPARRTITAFDPAGRRYVGLVGAEVVSPTDVLDLVAAKVRVNAEHDQSALLTTTRKAGSTVPDGHLYVRTNDGAGGNRVVVDQDLLQAKKIVVAETVGDGNGSLRIETDATDLATLTRPANSTDPSLLTHDLAIATNDGQGGNTIRIDKDTVKAKQLTVVEAATIGGGLTLEQGGDLSIQGGTLALQEVGGGTDTDEMLIYRRRRPGGASDRNDIVLQIGDGMAGGDRLVIGPLFGGELKEQVVFDNRGDGSLKRNLTVGAGADGSILVRHVKGKATGNDAHDHLYLNWDTGRNVEVGQASNPAALNVSGALKAANLFGGVTFRVAAGRTTPGSTAWQPYDSDRGIYLDVDTSTAGFTSTPLYLTSLHGSNEHWATTGGSSVYFASPGSFRIFIRWADGSNLTPARANTNQWHIQWIGIQV